MACSADNDPISAPDDISCQDLPWSECPDSCTQTKKVQIFDAVKKTCKVSRTISRPCYASSCPVVSGDYIIFIDLKALIWTEWSYVVSEDFFNAVADIFSVSFIYISFDYSKILNFRFQLVTSKY